LGLKLPPYFDPVHFKKLYDILSNYTDIIKFLTAINSVGNALIIDPDNECVVIKPKKGLGGLGGNYIKPIALSNISQLYRLLGDNMIIIGCGGISTGLDVFEQILCGASFCQIGSQLMIEGEGCFKRIQNELIEIMKKKEYYTLNDFKGKLKMLD
jgi:dihydroorotate dehydrogenase (fumarate)